METSTPGGEANPIKRFLQTRNVGLCMCHNRLLGFHVVRSTVPTIFLYPQFTFDPTSRIARQEAHLQKVARYPDKHYYLQEIQYYFFRNEALRHLRPGQFFRYFKHRREEDQRKPLAMRTDENTIGVDDESRVPDDPTHRHYDSKTAAGTAFPCARLRITCASSVRRQNSNFCVPRSSFLEPVAGVKSEAFYEQRLLLGLPWHCAEKPSFEGEPPHVKSRWTFATTAPHTPEELRTFTMCDRTLDNNLTMEGLCLKFEAAYRAADVCCPCCEDSGDQCESCKHALGWHICAKDVAELQAAEGLGDDETAEERWRTGTLHSGKLDVMNTLWTLARRLVPLAVLREKLAEYVRAGQVPEDEVDGHLEVFEQMSGVIREANVFADPAIASTRATDAENRPMSGEELRTELALREKFMQKMREEDGVWTEQWRVYHEIVQVLTANAAPLRSFLQASAGTGKSFLWRRCICGVW